MPGNILEGLPVNAPKRSYSVCVLLWAFLILAAFGCMCPGVAMSAPAGPIAGPLNLVGGAGGGGGGGGAAASGGGGVAEAIVTYYSVSGSVRTPSDAPVEGVAMGGLAGTNSGFDGAYAGSVPAGWSGTVTPAKTGWVFTPVSRSYANVASDQPDQDYVAEGVGSARVYVNANHTGAEDGTSWATAFDTIQEGVDAAFAAGGGEVWVAAGTYTSTVDPVVTLREYVAVYGGFAGNETSLDQSDFASNPTTIDGEGARRCVVGANTAAIDGFMIVNGLAGDGAGMYNDNASPYVMNCVFMYNAADAAYAVPAKAGGLPEAITLLQGKSGGGFGGAAASGGGGTAAGVLAYGSGTGGGMHNAESNPVVYNCVFESNTASDGGGGMYNTASSPSVTNALFVDNNAGAGLALLQGKSGGGVSGAALGGGGMAASVVSYVAGSGGGMRNDSSLPTVTNCTFVGNTAVDGGALFNQSSQIEMTNSILWNNGPNSMSGTEDSVELVTYSDVQGGQPGEGNIDADPLFLDEAFQLMEGSPCIDTGTSNGAPETDIWYIPRPQGNGVDMGIHER